MRLHTPDACFLKCALYSGQGCSFKTTRPDKLRLHLAQKHNLEHHDKISLPAAPSSSISLAEEVATRDAREQGKKEVSIEVIEPFKDLNFVASQGFEVKEEIFPSLQSPAKVSDAISQTTRVDSLPSEISDILLEDDQDAPIKDSGSLCMPDSYETYAAISSSSQENSVILPENMGFNSQAIEGDSTLVLMSNIQVLNALPSEENLTASSTAPFERKADASSPKMDQMMESLPVILQTDKNLTYLHPNHMTLSHTERSREFSENNIEEFTLRDCNMTIDDTNRTLQFIKLSDSSITFLPQEQEEDSVVLETSSVTIESDAELKETDSFKSFTPTQFSLF